MGILKSCLIFVSGAAIGSGVTWYLMNKKVKEANDSIQEAVDQVKLAYSNSRENQNLKEEIKFDNKLTTVDGDSNAYQKTVDDIKDLEKNLLPKIISPEEFEENMEDKHVYLTYYAKDCMVVDNDTGLEVEHPESILGEFFMDIFDDFNTDVVYINDENNSTLYELVIDDEMTVNDAIVNHNVFEDNIDAEGGD